MAEDIQGIPDADLSPILDQLQETQAEAQVKQEKNEDDRPRNKYGQFTKKDGSLDEDGVLKSYKEIQAAFTRVSQENKLTKEQLAQTKEELELSKYQAPAPMYQPQQGQTEDDNPVKTFTVMRIAEVLEDESEKSKNKAEFQDRYAYAQMVSREYPQLSTSARGVKKLFELGDKLRNEHLKKNAGKALESIFGEPLGEEEIARLRTLVKGDKSQSAQQTKQNMNAYMPDTSTSTRSGADQNQNPNTESQIKESVKKGDVDGVISAIFRKALAE